MGLERVGLFATDWEGDLDLWMLGSLTTPVQERTAADALVLKTSMKGEEGGWKDTMS